MNNSQTNEEKTLSKLLSSMSTGKHAFAVVNLGLTFAGLHAIQPTVTQCSVASTSTIFIPSAARSATADSPGFVEHAAVWTVYNRRGDAWSGR